MEALAALSSAADTKERTFFSKCGVFKSLHLLLLLAREKAFPTQPPTAPGG